MHQNLTNDVYDEYALNMNQNQYARYAQQQSAAPDINRINQLLNDLYHDRARMEDVIENAANLADQASETIAENLGKLHPGAEAILDQQAVDLLIVAGQLRQFADEHGG
jgi:ABC-type transporter Mla subunit MlaD